MDPASCMFDGDDEKQKYFKLLCVSRNLVGSVKIFLCWTFLRFVQSSLPSPVVQIKKKKYSKRHLRAPLKSENESKQLIVISVKFFRCVWGILLKSFLPQICESSNLDTCVNFWFLMVFNLHENWLQKIISFVETFVSLLPSVYVDIRFAFLFFVLTTKQKF